MAKNRYKITLKLACKAQRYMLSEYANDRIALLKKNNKVPPEKYSINPVLIQNSGSSSRRKIFISRITA